MKNCLQSALFQIRVMNRQLFTTQQVPLYEESYKTDDSRLFEITGGRKIFRAYRIAISDATSNNPVNPTSRTRAASFPC